MIQKLKRLFKWIPLIWRTGDWDYGYTLEILSASLEELADHLENHDISEGAEQKAKQMRFTSKMISRHLNEVASDLVYDRHNEKWGDPIYVQIPIPDTEFHEIRFERLYARTVEEREQEEEEMKEAFYMAQRLEDRDWNLIWDTIKEHMRGWWC